MQSQNKQVTLKFEIYTGSQLKRTELLMGPRIKVGTLNSAQLCIKDEGVSRIHALIEVKSPTEVEILDLGSQRGTYLNGAQISKASLKAGDQLQFGAAQVKVSLAAQDAPPRRFTLPPDEEELEGGPQSLEVLVLWGSSVIKAQHISTPGAFTLGESPKADQFIDPTLLPQDLYPIAEWQPEGPLLNLPRGSQAEVMIGAEIYGLKQLREAGMLRRSQLKESESLLLPPGGRCRLSFGEFKILLNSVNQAPSVERGSPLELMDAQQILFLLFAGFLHGLFFLIVQSMPQEMNSLSLDRFETPDRFSELLFIPEEQSPQEKLVDIFGEIDEEEAPAASGDEGSLGHPKAVQKRGRLELKGKEDQEEIKLARERARQQAIATAEAAFEGLEQEMATVWGTEQRSAGGEALTALGDMFGERTGTQHGYGIGVAGVGRGGGMPGEHSVGVPWPTRGLRGLKGSPRPSIYAPRRKSIERKLKGPKIIPKPPVIKGSLEKEEIRRVIRRHRNEYRYCYEKQLNLKRDLNGKIVVKFIIGGDGSVLASSIQESSMNNRVVESCLMRKIKRWIFPPPKGGGMVTVQYPLIFKKS